MPTTPRSTRTKSKPTKQQSIYKSLRERIVSGAYGPGYRVVIDTLAVEFGVSALPVREAIRRLEAEGLVVYRPNAGAQVTPADPAMFKYELGVLAVLEGYLTALTAPELDKSALDELRRATDEMTAAKEEMDPISFGRHNREFHQAIYARCPNPALAEMASGVDHRLDAIRRTVYTHIPYRGTKSIEEHRRLIELIATNAPPEEIEKVARAHKLGTLESFRGWERTHGLDES